jgi:hypothetical protein
MTVVVTIVEQSDVEVKNIKRVGKKEKARLEPCIWRDIANTNFSLASVLWPRAFASTPLHNTRPFAAIVFYLDGLEILEKVWMKQKIINL